MYGGEPRVTVAIIAACVILFLGSGGGIGLQRSAGGSASTSRSSGGS